MDKTIAGLNGYTDNSELAEEERSRGSDDWTFDFDPKNNIISTYTPGGHAGNLQKRAEKVYLRKLKRNKDAFVCFFPAASAQFVSGLVPG